MPQRKIHSVNKVLTEEERVRHRAIREQVEQEKAELMARGRRAKARHIMLREAVAALKTTREALGLSLTDIKASTGIEKSNLSRLENDPLANPTIDTLCRYAEAVGKEIVITLVDISKESSRRLWRRPEMMKIFHFRRRKHDDVLSGCVPAGGARGKLPPFSCHGLPVGPQQYLTALYSSGPLPS